MSLPDKDKDKDKDKYSPKITPKIDPDTECKELLSIVKGLYDKYFEDDYARSKLVSHI